MAADELKLCVPTREDLRIRQMMLADVIVYAPYRGRGYGRKGLGLLCQAAVENGVDVLYDNIAMDFRERHFKGELLRWSTRDHDLKKRSEVGL